MIKSYLVGALAVIAFASGWYVSHMRDVRNYQQETIALQQSYEAQLKSTQELSQRLQETANEADKTQAVAENSIDADYSQRLERLRNDTDSTSSDTDLSSSTGATCEVSASIREHNARIRRAFRELREEVLTVARDRDITASHYNELISLYNKLLEQYNNGNSSNGE